MKPDYQVNPEFARMLIEEWLKLNLMDCPHCGKRIPTPKVFLKKTVDEAAKELSAITKGRLKDYA